MMQCFEMEIIPTLKYHNLSKKKTKDVIRPLRYIYLKFHANANTDSYPV